MRWRTGNFGALQRDPEHYWNVIARNVHIHRSDVEELREGTVVLANGSQLQTDLLLLATGLKQSHPYFSSAEAGRLGLPVPFHDSQRESHWTSLHATADAAVLTRWPFLANPPSSIPTQQPATHTPYRLYNHIIPLSDSSIAFLGIPLVPNSYHVALVQSLYAIAALTGPQNLHLPSQQDMEANIAFVNAWNARKYLATGKGGNQMDFEMVSYTDSLLRELGLRSHEQESWWMHVTEPVWGSDYAGLVDEFRGRYVGGEAGS